MLKASIRSLPVDRGHALQHRASRCCITLTSTRLDLPSKASATFGHGRAIIDMLRELPRMTIGLARHSRLDQQWCNNTSAIGERTGKRHASTNGTCLAGNQHRVPRRDASWKRSEPDCHDSLRASQEALRALHPRMNLCPKLARAGR